MTMGAIAYRPTPTPERKTATLLGSKDGVTRIN